MLERGEESPDREPLPLSLEVDVANNPAKVTLKTEPGARINIEVGKGDWARFVVEERTETQVQTTADESGVATFAIKADESFELEARVTKDGRSGNVEQKVEIKRLPSISVASYGSVLEEGEKAYWKCGGELRAEGYRPQPMCGGDTSFRVRLDGLGDGVKFYVAQTDPPLKSVTVAGNPSELEEDGFLASVDVMAFAGKASLEEMKIAFPIEVELADGTRASGDFELDEWAVKDLLKRGAEGIRFAEDDESPPKPETAVKLWLGKSVVGPGATLADVDLVIVGKERKVKRSTCRYTGGVSIERETENLDLKVHDRRTGRVVATKTIPGQAPPACPGKVVSANYSSYKESYSHSDANDWADKWLAKNLAN